MKYTILFLTLIILAGCKSPVEPEGEYPLQINTWTLQSETNAKWNGTTVMAKQTASPADSIIVTDTTVHKISLEHLDDSRQFHVFLTDSTINSTMFGSFEEGYEWNYEVEFPDAIVPELGQGFFSNVRVQGRESSPNHVMFTFNVSVKKCFESDYPAGEQITLDLWDKDGEHIRHYIFEVDGMVETIKHILC